MKFSKIFAVSVLFALSTGMSSAAYEVLDCSSDAVFGANSCTQCFDGGKIAAGDSVGFLTDDFVNNDTTSKIIYKEEQEMPKMLALDSANASWSQTPSSEDFWEYTEGLNALFSEEEDGYIVPGNQKVTWLQSKLGYAYKLDTNAAAADANIGLLVYTLLTHDVSTAGDIALESKEHKECVLFKSATTPTTPVTPETPEEPQTPPELPQTGPEHIVLALIALLLGFGLLMLNKKTS